MKPTIRALRNLSAQLQTFWLLLILASTTITLYAAEAPGESCIARLFDQELLSTNTPDQELLQTLLSKGQKTADALVLVYMAADNDLRNFAIRNIRQMIAVGSNANAHIVIHIDIRDTNNTKVTRRYYVTKGQCIPLNENDPHTQCMDSGNPETLISFVDTAVSQFPANKLYLFFWDHGTGYLDPIHRHRVNPSTLFNFNPTSCKLELERPIPYLSFTPDDSLVYRGVCWDQTTKNFLSSEKLDYALDTICRTTLNGKRFSIIGFDACLMSMLEIADLVAPYADILVGSEEAILGTGFDYTMVLKPLLSQNMNPKDFAEHVVDSFKKTYAKLTQDFALSALDLTGTQEITNNLDLVAQLLIICLENQRNGSVKKAIQNARKQTVHFNEPSYLDIYNLYNNILANLQSFDMTQNMNTSQILKNLETTLRQGQRLMDQYIFANVVGQKLASAHGISLYFPERMHASYSASAFARSNSWFKFVQKYILG